MVVGRRNCFSAFVDQRDVLLRLRFTSHRHGCRFGFRNSRVARKTKSGCAVPFPEADERDGMDSRQHSFDRNRGPLSRFVQAHAWLGWIAQLGAESALRVSERRSSPSGVLLERWARVQSSRISAGNPVDRALALFVDGRTASVLGENNFSALLCGVRAAARVAGVAVVR